MFQSLASALDPRRRGTHFSDRMHRILGVCQDCGVLWHEERVSFRNGVTELKRIEDVQPVGSVLVTPRYEKYGLHVNPRVLPRLKTMAPQFAYALNVPGTSVEVDGNVVYVRLPRPRDDADDIITFKAAWSIVPDVPTGHLLLGVDEDHQQLVLDLTSPTNVHAAVIGMTGSGKSTLMRSMILSAQLSGGSQVALFDPSGGFQPLSGHPSVWRGGLFTDPEECERGLEALTRGLGRARQRLTFVFVDEVPELVVQRPRIKAHLARLAQVGRHAGLHLILGAQHPLASELGPTTMRNVAVRLVGRVADRNAAYNATARRDTGAECLRGGGDFVYVNGGTLRHFQAAMVSAQTLEAWARRYPPRPPRVPVRPTARRPLQRDSAAGWDPHGGPGRPLDDIPPKVIGEIRRYVHEHGQEPSSNWVYQRTKEMLSTGGYNRSKARRALAIARDGALAQDNASGGSGR